MSCMDGACLHEAVKQYGLELPLIFLCIHLIYTPEDGF